MEVVVGCSICQALGPCDCKEAVAAYFRLLQLAHDRVLSANPASEPPSVGVAGGGMDKLEAILQEAAPTDSLLIRAKAEGYSVRRTVLRDRRLYLEIRNLTGGIHLRLGPGGAEVVGLVSNPNHFGSWASYFEFIRSILPETVLRAARVTRLDLNLDLKSSFSDVLQSIDFRNKRTSLQYATKSGIRTGLTVGTGPEQIAIYDKAEQAHLAGVLTRIEIRMRGSKLPTRSIFELPNKILSGDFFSGIEGYTLEYPYAMLLADQDKRLSEFKSILQRDGLYAARTALNQNRNFNRDFAKLIHIDKWPVSPSQLFATEIGRFFLPTSRALRVVAPIEAERSH